jgi:hypothetical protein
MLHHDVQWVADNTLKKWYIQLVDCLWRDALSFCVCLLTKRTRYDSEPLVQQNKRFVNTWQIGKSSSMWIQTLKAVAAWKRVLRLVSWRLSLLTLWGSQWCPGFPAKLKGESSFWSDREKTTISLCSICSGKNNDIEEDDKSCHGQEENELKRNIGQKDLRLRWRLTSEAAFACLSVPPVHSESLVTQDLNGGITGTKGAANYTIVREDWQK